MHNTNNFKPKIQPNHKMMTFDFRELQIYLWTGKVTFASGPHIYLALLNVSVTFQNILAHI